MQPNHSVKLSNGKVCTNASPRTYTHAVVGTPVAGNEAKVLRWCQSALEAGQAFARYSPTAYRNDLGILPVTRTPDVKPAVREPTYADRMADLAEDEHREDVQRRQLDNRAQALRMLGQYTRGRFRIWDLAGRDNAMRRAQVLGMLLGRIVPQRESGITAFTRALYAAVGIDRVSNTLSNLEKIFIEKSRCIVENNPAELGNVPAGQTQVPNTKDNPMASKKSPAASKKTEAVKSDVATEASAAVAAVTEQPAKPKADKPAKAKKVKADKPAAETPADKASEQAWPDGYLPYLLEGSDRIELLSDEQAKIRNANREKKDKDGRWVVRHDADPAKVDGPFMSAKEAVLKALEAEPKATLNSMAIATATKVVESVVKIELGVAQKEGLVENTKVAGFYKLTDKGRELVTRLPAFLKYPPAQNRKITGSSTEQTKAEVKDADAAEAKPKKEKAPKADKPARPEWNGLGMCELIRYCGSKQLTKAQINAVCVKAGFAPSKTTVAIQSKKGSDGEQVPEVKKDAAAEVKAWAAEVKEEPKKSKKSKPAKERVKVAAAEEDDDAE